MTFFNKKTEVMQIEMTPYGRYLYSIGKFKPHSYEFVDDDIVYRIAGSQESTQGQGTAHKRIIEETPKLKINRAFQEEAPQLQFPARIESQRVMNKKMDLKQNSLFTLGRSSYSSDISPTLQASMIQGRISASFMNLETNRTVDGGAGSDTGSRILIPQVNIEYNIIATLRNELVEPSFVFDLELSNTSQTLDNGDYISLNYQEPIIHLKEFGSFYEKENFEIEVYLEESNGSLKPLKMFKKTNPIVNDLLIDNLNSQFQQILDSADADLDIINEDFVEYYFSINVDNEIPQEDLCRAIDKLEINNQFLDEELICPDQRTSRFDIYSTRVDPSDLEDCDK